MRAWWDEWYFSIAMFVLAAVSIVGLAWMGHPEPARPGPTRTTTTTTCQLVDVVEVCK